MALSYKRKVFVETYLQTWNAAKAARQAGYRHPDRQGPRLLSFVEVQQEIKARLAEACMAADEVLARLSQQASADISDFLTEGGAIDWQKVMEKGYLIKSVLHRKGQQSRIELYDAQAALQLIGKYHRLFVDRVEGEIKHQFPQFDKALERIYDGDDGVA